MKCGKVYILQQCLKLNRPGTLTISASSKKIGIPNVKKTNVKKLLLLQEEVLSLTIPNSTADLDAYKDSAK